MTFCPASSSRSRVVSPKRWNMPNYPPNTIVSKMGIWRMWPRPKSFLNWSLTLLLVWVTRWNGPRFNFICKNNGGIIWRSGARICISCLMRRSGCIVWIRWISGWCWRRIGVGCINDVCWYASLNDAWEHSDLFFFRYDLQLSGCECRCGR